MIGKEQFVKSQEYEPKKKKEVKRAQSPIKGEKTSGHIKRDIDGKNQEAKGTKIIKEKKKRHGERSRSGIGGMEVDVYDQNPGGGRVGAL